MCDKTGAYCTSVAVVDPVNGVDASGAVTGTFNSSSPPAAYKTLAAAFNALRGYNNTNYSRNNCGGSIIYVRGTGTTEWIGGSITAGTTPACSLLVAAFPGDTGCTLGTQTGGKALGNYVKIQGCSITDGGVVSFFDSSTWLWFDGCTLDCTGTAPIYHVQVYHLTWCVITKLANGFGPFSTVNSAPGVVRGSTGSPGTGIAYTVVGNDFTATVISDVSAAGQSSQTIPTPANMIVAFNRVGNSGQVMAFRQTSVADSHGIAVVQNVFEGLASPDTEPVVQIAADSTTMTPVNNVIFWHNTIVGGRANIGYNEVDTASGGGLAIRWHWSVKNNLFDLGCIKADTFAGAGYAADGAKIGNWSFDWGCGCSGNINGEYTGFSASGSFCFEFIGLKSDQPPTSGSPPGCATRADTYPDYTDRESYTGSGGAGAGGGVYTISTSSAPEVGLPRDFVLLYDLAGASRASDASGAYAAPATAAATAGDTIGFSGSATAHTSASRSAADSIAVSQAATANTAGSRTASDTIALTDSASGSATHGASRTAADTIVVSETATATSAASRTAADSITASASASANTTASRTAADTITASSTATGSGTHSG
ncbi:MAG: hypothetical protein ACRDNS_03010, partial [Trebonia sp.]